MSKVTFEFVPNNNTSASIVKITFTSLAHTLIVWLQYFSGAELFAQAAYLLQRIIIKLATSFTSKCELYVEPLNCKKASVYISKL